MVVGVAEPGAALLGRLERACRARGQRDHTGALLQRPLYRPSPGGDSRSGRSLAGALEMVARCRRGGAGGSARPASLGPERSEERRDGKEGVSTCSSWWSAYHIKKHEHVHMDHAVHSIINKTIIPYAKS